jgi:hypothetical protein
MMIGAASPLWGYFTGAAMAGMAFWWANHWMRPEALEAAAEAVVAPTLALVAEEASEVEAIAEAALEVAEAAVEPVLEAVVEAAAGPVAMAVVSDELPMFPVGGEAAPFGAAVLEAELIEKPEFAAELALEQQEQEEPLEEAEAPPSAEAAASPAPKPRKPRGESTPKPH